MKVRASIYDLEEPGIRERWQALQEVSIIRTPFSNLDYVESLSQATGRRVAVVLARESKDISGALLFERRIGPLLKAGPVGFTPFTPLSAERLPHGAEVHGEESWYHVLAETLMAHYGMVDLYLPPAITDVRAFQWSGWQATPFYTFRLSLTDPEARIAAWSESARRTFHRKRERYRLVEGKSSSTDIVDLCIEGYARAGRRPPLERRQLSDLVSRLASTDRVRCFTLRDAIHDTPSAGVAVLIEGSDAYYWVAGSKPGPAMTVMIGELVHCLAAGGIETFDFVGANTPAIAEFKRRFNPDLIPYYRVRGIRSRALRIFSALLHPFGA